MLRPPRQAQGPNFSDRRCATNAETEEETFFITHTRLVFVLVFPFFSFPFLYSIAIFLCRIAFASFFYAFAFMSHCVRIFLLTQDANL